MSLASLLVHKGLDDWLFLTGGSNFVTTLYQRDGGHLPDSALTGWRDAIIARKARCDALGARYAHIVIPEKLTIYGHKLAAPLVDPDLAPGLRLVRLFDGDPAACGYIDLIALMRAHRDNVDLYWRTDTHWTPMGCLLGYETLCDALGLERNDALVERPFVDDLRLMDLGSKLDPPVYEPVREVTWLQDATRVYHNNVVRLLEAHEYGGEIHVGSHAIFKNPRAPNDCRLMLFGDSFSGVSPHLFTALFAETVRELEFVWSANVDWGLVKRARPDIVVTEIAERYMALPPNDRFSLHATEIRQAMLGRRRRFEAWLRDKRAKWRQGPSRSP
ncbi:alginate O-acetyltransferase AlgX-related protein [Methylocystis sp. S23]